MTATAAVATQVADPSRKPDLLAMFDIAGGHERVEARLRNVLDGNGAAGADLEILERKASAQAIRVVAEADTSWSYGSRSFAGRAKGSVEYVSPGALKQVMKQRCEEWSKSKPVMDLLRSKLASDPKAGMLLPAEFPLGAVPHTVGCEEHCTRCRGTGNHDCHMCRNGKVNCFACGGFGDLHVTGQQYRVRCRTCCGNRTVGCQGCAATGWVPCAPCGASGIITTLCEGTVSAKVVYRTEPHDGFDQAWHAALTRNGHAWLVDICKAGNAPRLAEAPGGIAAQWSIAVQVLTQRFRILGKAYEAVFVGNKETVWSMPRFLDATAKPIADELSRATPVEAFSIADRHPVSKEVRRVVLDGGEDEQIRGRFESAVSPEFVQRLRLSLQRARDTIASHAIKAAWRRAIPVSLLVVGYGVGTGLFGRLLPSPRGSGGATTGDLNLFAGLVVFCALFGASYWLAGNAGRNALKVALGTPVKAIPPQGKAPAIAALVGILLYAGIAYFVGRSGPAVEVAPAVSAAHAGTSGEPMPTAVPTASDLYDRSFPKVAPPTVPFSGR